MLDVQHPLSMCSAFGQETHKQHADFSHSIPFRDSRWGAGAIGRDSKDRDCAHTPPLLSGHRHSGTTYGGAIALHGLITPPENLGDMSGMNGMSGNPLLNPNIGGQHYQQRVPLVASNAPPYPNNRPTVDNIKATSNRQPFYNSYYSAKRPSSPALHNKDGVVQNEQTVRRRASSDGNSIASHLQIPASINDSKGSLPEFAAQITCFFWFESSFTLHIVEDDPKFPGPITPLVPEAMPTTGFRKWVTTILSMTQVSQNVILLALMFIYRLKKFNPGVKGKIGSEFRLLTVALMLGNKFLDDNTYTNKTWAEVSGISVQEIHVMEVEFLSNMRYTLFASKSDWEAWHIKLGKFSDFYDKASQIQSNLRNLALPTPQFSVPRDLPSPSISTNSSPPYLNHSAPNAATLPHPLSMPPYLGPKDPSPTGSMPELDPRQWVRKRSLEEYSSEPPSKRLNSIVSSAASSITLTPSTLHNTPAVPRLPMPNLSISTDQQQNSYNASTTQLPMPTSRAMSTVYPGHNSQPQNNVQLPSLHPSTHSNKSGNRKGLSSLEFPTRQTPYTSAASTPSPTSYQFPQHTPNGLSPSGWPAPRTSPYKPIRGVNTLLVPPPSASIQNHPQNVSYGQMHYQPLGKPVSERKTGVLPYFPFNTWSQPPHLQPCLPQPSFAS